MFLARKNKDAGPSFSQLAPDHQFASAEHTFPSSSIPSSSQAIDSASPSLKETLRKRLLNDMIHCFANEPTGVAMLVDDYTMRVISSLCRMSELLDENIHIVENLTMKNPTTGDFLRRQPLPV